MPTHPDAYAFMRNYLDQPADAVTRLVFADWLEETGEPQNAAWAHFIRLKIEADRHDFGSRERRELDRQADAFARDIRARLTISAKRFVGYPKSLLQLLPAPNITVRLADFEFSREKLDYLPQSVIREHLLFPLDMLDPTLLLATVTPRNPDLAQRIGFILNRDIVFVRAEREDVLAAIEREYGSEADYLASMFPPVEPIVIVWEPQTTSGEDDSVVGLVNMLLVEAASRRADRVTFRSEPDALVVRHHVRGEWTERDSIPVRLLRPVISRLAEMAGINPAGLFAENASGPSLMGNFRMSMQSARFNFRVLLQFPPHSGPVALLDISEAPA